MQAETIVFEGVVYYRYPDAKRESDRRYYKRQGKRLHAEIWKSHHGPIPKGHVIHHKDGNPGNNDIENLELLEHCAHTRLHHKGKLSERKREHLAEIRPLAAEWHRSDEGREWHSDHGKKAWAVRKPIRKRCVQCGVGFDSIARRDGDRFCSNNCKSAWRRASGIDDETRTCPTCGRAFVVNKYSRVRHCCRSCSARGRRRGGASL